MPAKVSFTQKEELELEQVIKYAARNCDVVNLQKLLDKMKAARTKESVAFHGVGVAKVIEMAEEKFGDRFKKPTTITAQWSIKMQKAINDSGVSLETAQKAIANCDWQGEIFAQQFIYKLAELAVMTSKGIRQGKLFGIPVPTKKSGWLGRLDEE